MKTKQLYQIATTFLKGIGPRKAAILFSSIPEIEVLFEASIHDLHEISGIPLSTLFQMDRANALEMAKRQLDFVNKNNLNTHFYLDSNYPRRLKQCPDAPLLVYSKGNLNPNPLKAVSIVGTRHSTEYGRNLTLELIQGIKSHNVQIVSGLAYGTDYNAHKIALDCQLTTIGILGHGLDRIYPHSHRDLAEKMCLNGGGLLTEFSSNTIPDKINFPMRNRIVAGMADALVVVESKTKGGSMITAEMAFDYNREVFAFPGCVNHQNSSGCNLLIQKNMAHLIAEPNDLVKLLEWNNGESPQLKVEEETLTLENLDMNVPENQIIVLLTQKGKIHFDQLSVQLNYSPQALNSTLFNMELMGKLKSLPGRMYSL